MDDAELWRRRTEVFQAKVRRTERLGRLAVVFDGYGLSLYQEAGSVPVLVSWTDFDAVADALETGGRAKPYHQMGFFEGQHDGSFFMWSYDWNVGEGEVTVPAEQISPLVSLLRSLPFPPYASFHTTDGKQRREFRLVVVHRGELDRDGNKWPHETPVAELYESHQSDDKVATRFIATLGLDELLDRPSDEPLRVSTPTGALVVRPADLAPCMPQLRRAVRPERGIHRRT